MSPGEDFPRVFARRRVGLVLGPAFFLVMLLCPTPAGMTPEGRKMAGVALLMATWWMCESIPIPATSLLPVALFPLLGILPTQETTSQYAGHLIFLFMGGFIIALSMQRWNLHRRMALHIVKVVGFSPGKLILGFMIATAALSAFVSNTATTVMMMPIGLAIILQSGNRAGVEEADQPPPQESPFGLNLMLGIAYAASIGGMATLIGSPPNTVLAAYLHGTYGYEMTFSRWMMVGVPLAVVLLPLCWFWLTRVANPMTRESVPGGKDLVNRELDELGPVSAGERWTGLVFLLTALAWIFAKPLRSLLPAGEMVTDATIGMTGALLLFIIPINLKQNTFVMNWRWATKMPWGVLVLFGGGLALAHGFKSTGLAGWIGGQVTRLESAPLVLMLLAIVVLIVFLTELTSNTATSAMAMPILAPIALGLNQDPLLFLVPAAMAASCAFMLPVATPPNAIVFGSGYVTIPQMSRTGLGLNLISVAVIMLLAYTILIRVFGITVGSIPIWAR